MTIPTTTNATVADAIKAMGLDDPSLTNPLYSLNKSLSALGSLPDTLTKSLYPESVSDQLRRLTGSSIDDIASSYGLTNRSMLDSIPDWAKDEFERVARIQAGSATMTDTLRHLGYRDLADELVGVARPHAPYLDSIASITRGFDDIGAPWQKMREEMARTERLIADATEPLRRCLEAITGPARIFQEELSIMSAQLEATRAEATSSLRKLLDPLRTNFDGFTIPGLDAGFANPYAFRPKFESMFPEAFNRPYGGVFEDVYNREIETLRRSSEVFARSGAILDDHFGLGVAPFRADTLEMFPGNLAQRSMLVELASEINASVTSATVDEEAASGAVVGTIRRLAVHAKRISRAEVTWGQVGGIITVLGFALQLAQYFDPTPKEVADDVRAIKSGVQEIGTVLKAGPLQYRTTEKVHLRESPARGSASLDLLPPGSVVTLISQKGDWYMVIVQAPGSGPVAGYIFGKFLEKLPQ